MEDVTNKIVAYDLDPLVAVLPWPLCLLPSGLFAKCGNFFLCRFLVPWLVAFCKVNQDNLEKLRNYERGGAILWCVTARPENCRRSTRRWLKDNKVPFVLLYMGTNNKVEFCHDNHVGTYLDTNPKKAFSNVEKATQLAQAQPGEE